MKAGKATKQSFSPILVPIYTIKQVSSSARSSPAWLPQRPELDVIKDSSHLIIFIVRASWYQKELLFSTPPWLEILKSQGSPVPPIIRESWDPRIRSEIEPRQWLLMSRTWGAPDHMRLQGHAALELLSLRVIGERDYDSRTDRVWIAADEETRFHARYLPERSAWLTGALLINTLNRIAHLTGQLSSSICCCARLLLICLFFKLSPAVLLRPLYRFALCTESARASERAKDGDWEREQEGATEIPECSEQRRPFLQLSWPLGLEPPSPRLLRPHLCTIKVTVPLSPLMPSLCTPFMTLAISLNPAKPHPGKLFLQLRFGREVKRGQVWKKRSFDRNQN